MKAYEVQQFGIENLALVERERPKPAAREVLVKFRAASLNYRDLMVAEGTYNPRMKMPAVPLSDGAGEVVALGEGATRWKAGDRVMPIFAQRWIDGDVTEEKRRTSLGAGAQWDGVLREFGAFDEDGLVGIPEVPLLGPTIAIGERPLKLVVSTTSVFPSHRPRELPSQPVMFPWSRGRPSSGMIRCSWIISWLRIT